MASKHREENIVAALACPHCHAQAGERCRNPVSHQTERGPEDRRAQPLRCHAERRAAWEEGKRVDA